MGCFSGFIERKLSNCNAKLCTSLQALYLFTSPIHHLFIYRFSLVRSTCKFPMIMKYSFTRSLTFRWYNDPTQTMHTIQTPKRIPPQPSTTSNPQPLLPLKLLFLLAPGGLTNAPQSSNGGSVFAPVKSSQLSVFPAAFPVI